MNCSKITSSLLIIIFALVGCAAPPAAQPAGQAVEAETAADAATRTIEHAAGTTEIPADPQRIVTLNDANVLAPLLELGAIDRIAGSAHAIENGEPVYRGSKDKDTSSITPVGQYGEPDLEKIAALDPDLIVGPASASAEENYSTYAKIAPTVLVRTFGVPISQYMDKYAELVNAQEQLDELEQRYQAAIQEVRDQVGDPSEVVVSMITAGIYADPGTIYTQDNWNSFQQVLKEIGFARPALQLQDDEPNTLSFERVKSQDGDLLLLLSFGGDESTPAEAAAPLTDSPLWSQLNAVQQDQAYLVPRRDEFGGSDYASRIAVLGYLTGLVEELDTSGDLSHVEIATPAGSGSSASGGAASSGTREFVDDASRTVQIPVRPQRIVATHGRNAGALVLSLDGPLVGIATRNGEVHSSITQYFDVSGIETVGEYYETDIEKVASLNPDVIVHQASNGEVSLEATTLERLEQIAPVVGFDVFQPVDQLMPKVADLIGTEEAQQRLAEQKTEYQDVLDELKGLLGDRWSEITASSLLFVGLQNPLRVGGPQINATNNILSSLGVSWTELAMEAAANGQYLGDISQEQLREYDADLLLVSAFGNPDYTELPLWNSLQVVQAGQVISVPDNLIGTHYPNYIASVQFLLDELRALQPIRTDVVDTDGGS